MEHIRFFYYILTFAVGFGTLFIYTLITFRTKDKLLLHILVFYCSFTAQIFLNIYRSYARENFEEFFLANFFAYEVAITIAGAIMIFSIPFFASYLAQFPFKKIGNICYALAGISYLVLELFVYKDVVISGELSLVTPVSVRVDDVILLLTVVYSTGVGIWGLRRVTDPQVKKLLRNVCITSLIFFPGLVAESVIYNKLPLPFFPALYCTFCIVFILFVIQVYFRDYFITESEVDLLVEREKKETEEGIFKHYNLSEREVDTIRLLLKGYSNKKIADELFISISTVKTHIHNVFKKTEVSNRYELIHLIKFEQDKS